MSERAQQSHVSQQQDIQQSISLVASKVPPLEIVENNNNNVQITQTPIQSSQPTSITSDELQVQTITPTTSSQSASVNPVRVLFQDQQQTQLHPHQQEELQLLVGQQTSSDEGDIIRAWPNEQLPSDTEPPSQAPGPISVINLNRQLIERQLEAMQAADSQRWNFDFRQNRPLRIEGHRYQVVQCIRPNRNTLNERNNQQTNMGTRSNDYQQQQQQRQQQQQQWQRLSTGQGSDCNQTHRDKPDHNQDDAQQ